MKEKNANIILVTAIVIIFIIVLVLIGSYFANISAKNECNRYKTDYKIKTIYNEPKNILYIGECYVVMGDGTEVMLQDFNIAMIKEPVRAE